MKGKLPGASKGRRSKKGAARWSRADLDRLIEEATVDCYNESEAVGGFYTMIEDNLAIPFETTILGSRVIVERLDLTEGDEIVAICRKGRQRQRICILDLPLPSALPTGAEWIAAYRSWLRGWS